MDEVATKDSEISGLEKRIQKITKAAKQEDTARVPREKGQHRDSSSHSDLFTDENPKGTIHGLKFATVEDAEKSVAKIKSSGKPHAHKIQAAIAMEQRAKSAGKISAAGVYRTYINSIKKSEINKSIDEKAVSVTGVAARELISAILPKTTFPRADVKSQKEAKDMITDLIKTLNNFYEKHNVDKRIVI